MAFSTITTAQIASGEPTSQDLFQKVKNDFDDHESRLSTLETSSNLFAPFNFEIVGPYGSGIAVDGLMHDVIRFNITVLNVLLFIHKAGVSGTTTIDVEYKRGVGAFTSILSAPLSVVYTSGDFFVASGTLSVTSLLANDIIRLNVDSAQVLGQGFSVKLEYEVA